MFVRFGKDSYIKLTIYILFIQVAGVKYVTGNSIANFAYMLSSSEVFGFDFLLHDYTYSKEEGMVRMPSVFTSV